MSISVITNSPIAYDSPDHTHPHGTMNDNNTCLPLLDYMRDCRGQYSLLDLGCSGGQFVADAVDRGNIAVGLEGSDYSLINGRASWPRLYGRNIFTCDISRPFQIEEDGWPMLFDFITAWEVLEHIPVDRLPTLINNIHNHIKNNGVFFCSIGAYPGETSSGAELHVSGHIGNQGFINIISQRFVTRTYPHKFSPRDDARGVSLFLECLPL